MNRIIQTFGVFGLLVAVPDAAAAFELRSYWSNLGSLTVPVAPRAQSEHACPPDMTRRVVQFSQPIETNDYYKPVAKQLANNLNMRRRNGISPEEAPGPRFRSAYDPDDLLAKPVELVFDANFQFCEYHGFVTLLQGVIKVSGTIGGDEVTYQGTLTGDESDGVSLVWMRTPSQVEGGGFEGRLLIGIETGRLEPIREIDAAQLDATVEATFWSTIHFTRTDQ